MNPYTEKELDKRMQNYYMRTGHYSPLCTLEYVFLKQLYWYCTRQVPPMESKWFNAEMYNNYIKLVNLSYKWNREDPDPNIHQVIIITMRLILRNEYSGPLTFIELNQAEHYAKMQKAIDALETWFTNKEYLGYASRSEFDEALSILRQEFNKHQIDFFSAVGKYPRKFRKRFNREDNHAYPVAPI